MYKSLCHPVVPVVRTTLLCTILFGNVVVVSVPRLSWCKMVPMFFESDNPWLPFSTLHLLPQVSLNYLPANRRMNLLFSKFSQTLNHANLVNHWKPFSWMLKFLLLDSNGTILTMLREEKDTKAYSFLVVWKFLIDLRWPYRLRFVHLFYSQEKPGKAWRGKKAARMAELFSLFTMFLPPVIYIEKKKLSSWKVWKSRHSAVNHIKDRVHIQPTTWVYLALLTWNNRGVQLSPASICLDE